MILKVLPYYVLRYNANRANDSFLLILDFITVHKVNSKEILEEIKSTVPKNYQSICVTLINDYRSIHWGSCINDVNKKFEFFIPPASFVHKCPNSQTPPHRNDVHNST